MKLNFWQWLGVVLLVVATIMWLMSERNESKEAEYGTPSTVFTETEDELDEEPTTEPLDAAPATAPAP